MRSIKHRSLSDENLREMRDYAVEHVDAAPADQLGLLRRPGIEAFSQGNLRLFLTHDSNSVGCRKAKLHLRTCGEPG